TETLLLFGRLKGLNITPQYLNVLMHIFRLQEIADHLVVTYSVGNRRKLSICVSMMGMPRMLLLDEPYGTIATTARKRIVNYISTLQRVSKMSILLSSHSLSDVEFLCNRIAIMGEGRLQCLGSLTHLKEKFGKGYTISVKTYPDKKQDFAYQQEVAGEVCKAIPRSRVGAQLPGSPGVPHLSRGDALERDVHAHGEDQEALQAPGLLHLGHVAGADLRELKGVCGRGARTNSFWPPTLAKYKRPKWTPAPRASTYPGGSKDYSWATFLK
ncbi:hypothetical protein MTO96_041096, partial [Rhipicephalus appendiculatus]